MLGGRLLLALHGTGGASEYPGVPVVHKPIVSVGGDGKVINLPLLMNTKIKEDKATPKINRLLLEDEELIMLVQVLIVNELI
jgi:hypothetical protein